MSASLKIRGFVWLSGILEKLWRKHSVEPFEVEEVFANAPSFRFVEKGHRKGENLYAASGQTDSGRYLITFFVYREDNYAVIISSRIMTDTERRNYERR